jgi:hypothetical protein
MNGSRGQFRLLFLKTYEVQLNFCVATLACPNVERGGGDLIDQWDRESQSSQVDTLYVTLAGVTRFDSDVVILGGVEVAEFRRSLFIAKCAGYSAETPVRRADSTDQITVAALGRGFRDS